MKKGKVIALTLSHKNGSKVLRAGDSVTEKDVDNFENLVKQGFIEVEESKAEKTKAKSDK